MGANITGIDGRPLGSGLPPINTAYAEGSLDTPLSIALHPGPGQPVQFIAVGGMHKLDRVAVEILLARYRTTLLDASDAEIAECFNLAARVLSIGQHYRETALAKSQGKAADNANREEGRH